MFKFSNETYSIDEEMIPFTGHWSVKQFVRKSRAIGLNNLVNCASSGLILDFEIHKGLPTPFVQP